jgi:hypothetical protein
MLCKPRSTTRAMLRTSLSLSTAPRLSRTGRETPASLLPRSLVASRSSSPTSKPAQAPSCNERTNTTISHGTQGILNTASKGTLENEFGTSNEDEVIKQILQKGDVQNTQVRHDITRPDSCELLSTVKLQAVTNSQAEL